MLLGCISHFLPGITADECVDSVSSFLQNKYRETIKRQNESLIFGMIVVRRRRVRWGQGSLFSPLCGLQPWVLLWEISIFHFHREDWRLVMHQDTVFYSFLCLEDVPSSSPGLLSSHSNKTLLLSKKEGKKTIDAKCHQAINEVFLFVWVIRCKLLMDRI